MLCRQKIAPGGGGGGGLSSFLLGIEIRGFALLGVFESKMTTVRVILISFRGIKLEKYAERNNFQIELVPLWR